MRSRYHPDGSIDYDADRALEILRHADEELERLQRVQQEKHSFDPCQGIATKSTPTLVASGMPTITDFLNDPMEELAKPILPDPLTHLNPTKL